MTRKFALPIAVVLVILATTSTALGFIISRKYEYYSDAAFTVLVGEEWDPGISCPNDEYFMDGDRADYRKTINYASCGWGGTQTVTCWSYDGTSWHQMTCP
jgi:hypothetical protein